MDTARHPDLTLPLCPLRPHTEHPDDSLIAQVQSGQQAAFKTLVERHQARVYAIAYRQLGDATLARDVTQNTFVALYQHIDHYQSRGQFRAYVARIAINQCRMAVRSRWLTKRLLPLPEARAHQPQLELNHDLQRALSGLSTKLREVTVLYYVGGLTAAEIAEQLQLPLGTVKRRLFDALVKLRACMEVV
jgi:RNA polymerase sigma-70 factor (ECF subfamily)